MKEMDNNKNILILYYDMSIKCNVTLDFSLLAQHQLHGKSPAILFHLFSSSKN